MAEIIKTNEGRKGGLIIGDAHSAPSGGVKAIVTDEKKPVLLEGQEVIINKKSVNSNTVHEFDGKKLTNKQILSAINTENGNGVPIYKEGGEVFEKGGVVDKNSLIEEYTERLNKAIVGLGYFTKISKSKTDFGKSNYILIDKEVDEFGIIKHTTNGLSKVRISDHSVVNFDRIFNEIHVSPKSIDDYKIIEHDVLNKIKFELDRNKYFEAKKGSRIETVRFETKDYNKDTDTILSERLTKAGLPIYNIDRKKNIETIDFYDKSDNKLYTKIDRYYSPRPLFGGNSEVIDLYGRYGLDSDNLEKGGELGEKELESEFKDRIVRNKYFALSFGNYIDVRLVELLDIDNLNLFLFAEDGDYFRVADLKTGFCIGGGSQDRERAVNSAKDFISYHGIEKVKEELKKLPLSPRYSLETKTFEESQLEKIKNLYESKSFEKLYEIISNSQNTTSRKALSLIIGYSIVSFNSDKIAELFKGFGYDIKKIQLEQELLKKQNVAEIKKTELDKQTEYKRTEYPYLDLSNMSAKQFGVLDKAMQKLYRYDIGVMSISQNIKKRKDEITGVDTTESKYTKEGNLRDTPLISYYYKTKDGYLQSIPKLAYDNWVGFGNNDVVKEEVKEVVEVIDKNRGQIVLPISKLTSSQSVTPYASTAKYRQELETLTEKAKETSKISIEDLRVGMNVKINYTRSGDDFETVEITKITDKNDIEGTNPRGGITEFTLLDVVEIYETPNKKAYDISKLFMFNDRNKSLMEFVIDVWKENYPTQTNYLNFLRTRYFRLKLMPIEEVKFETTEALSDEIVEKHKKLIRDGQHPVLIAQYIASCDLLDGFHKLKAYKELEYDFVPVIVGYRNIDINDDSKEIVSSFQFELLMNEVRPFNDEVLKESKLENFNIALRKELNGYSDFEILDGSNDFKYLDTYGYLETSEDSFEDDTFIARFYFKGKPVIKTESVFKAVGENGFYKFYLNDLKTFLEEYKKSKIDSGDYMLTLDEFRKQLPDCESPYAGENGIIYKAVRDKWSDTIMYFKNGKRTTKGVPVKYMYENSYLYFYNLKQKQSPEIAKETEEHIDTLNKVAEHEITPEEAVVEIVEAHKETETLSKSEVIAKKIKGFELLLKMTKDADKKTIIEKKIKGFKLLQKMQK